MKNSKPIYLLLLVFIVPMILSWGMYHYHQYFEFKTTNHGSLVKPPVDVASIFKGEEKKWRMVLVDSAMCESECQEVNYQLHQVQKALGKDQDRVTIVVMNKNFMSSKNISQSIFYSDNKKIKNKIYLVDPRGFLFMEYPVTTNLMNVLKDLKKVLEVSQIG
ncbi:MAG: hypothetical protein P4M12_01710 [Gammaproteobacteria bacterium]|nr:hypothetical protein [Gammaproteobacteria bacterium]